MGAAQPEPLPSLRMRVLELWRYPIKSIGGERLDVAELNEFGIVGEIRGAVENEAVELPGGVVSNRIMLRMKVPF